MAKDKRSHDQKRKAKLAKRTQHQAADVTPFEGKKYQAPRWALIVTQTEMGVYEVILWTGHRLTNQHAEAAFIQLVRQLRMGLSPMLAEGEPPVVYTPGNEPEFLIWNIRRNWSIHFEERGIVAVEDLIGILRTLLYSIEAHAWNTGPTKGYVHFIEGYMRRLGAPRFIPPPPAPPPAAPEPDSPQPGPIP
jgi:hypothetical protein